MCGRPHEWGKTEMHTGFLPGGREGHEGKGPLVRHRNRWILTVIVGEGVDFFHLPQDRDQW